MTLDPEEGRVVDVPGTWKRGHPTIVPMNHRELGEGWLLRMRRHHGSRFDVHFMKIPHSESARAIRAAVAWLDEHYVREH